jgi:hypothetical protein
MEDKKLYDAIKTDNIYSLVTEMNKLKLKREDIVQFICNNNSYILIFQFEDGRE